MTEVINGRSVSATLVGIHRFDGRIVLSLQGFASSDVTVYYCLRSTVREEPNPPRSFFLP